VSSALSGSGQVFIEATSKAYCHRTFRYIKAFEELWLESVKLILNCVNRKQQSYLMLLQRHVERVLINILLIVAHVITIPVLISNYM